MVRMSIQAPFRVGPDKESEASDARCGCQNPAETKLGLVVRDTSPFGAAPSHRVKARTAPPVVDPEIGLGSWGVGLG